MNRSIFFLFALIFINQSYAQFIVKNNQNNEVMRVNNDGKVGIGTAAPEYLFHLSSPANTMSMMVEGISQHSGDPSTYLMIRDIDSDNGHYWGMKAGQDGGFAIHQVIPNVESWDRITITPGGLVGIGTTTPIYNAHVSNWGAGASIGVSGTPAGIEILSNKDPQGYTHGYINFKSTVNGSGYHISHRDDTKDLMFYAFPEGTHGQFHLYTPLSPLSLGLNGHVGINGPQVNDYTLRIHGTIAGNGPYTHLSDRRLKTNFVNVDNALSKVSAMQAVYFDWQKESFPEYQFSQNRQVGFIAQEIRDIFPEAVSVDDNGIHYLSESAIVPLLVEALKEVNHKVDQLQRENTELKALLK